MNIADLRKKSTPKPVTRTQEQGVVSAIPPSPTHRESAPTRERAPLPAQQENAPQLEQSPLSAPAPLSNDGPSDLPASQRNRLDELFTAKAQHAIDAEVKSLTGAWTQEQQTVEEFRQMLSFSLGSEEYALDIHDIREIIKPRDITDIPRVPEFVLGIISLRGIVIPVFDLKRRFKLGTSILSPSSRIIVCQRANKSAGLLVDGISQVIKVSRASIEPPPPVLSGLERDLLDGIGRHRERMLILLNMPCVLNADLV